LASLHESLGKVEGQQSCDGQATRAVILDFYVASCTENGSRNLDSETARLVARSDKCLSGLGRPYLPCIMEE